MNILAHIVDFLREAGPRRWPGIADATGVPENTLRKLAYHDLKNPTLAIVQPLLDYAERVKLKKVKLPDPVPRATGNKPPADSPDQVTGGTA